MLVKSPAGRTGEAVLPEDLMEIGDWAFEWSAVSKIELPEGVTCVFRSNHASNYLSLKGDLPADRDKMLAVVRQAKENSDMLRPEYWRAL